MDDVKYESEKLMHMTKFPEEERHLIHIYHIPAAPHCGDRGEQHIHQVRGIIGTNQASAWLFDEIHDGASSKNAAIRNYGCTCGQLAPTQLLTSRNWRCFVLFSRRDMLQHCNAPRFFFDCVLEHVATNKNTAQQQYIINFTLTSSSHCPPRYMLDMLGEF